jgi:hypothetical protein
METLARGSLLLPLLGALLHLLLALAGGAEAWAHHGGGGFAGGGERRYRDLAAGRAASVRSSFGAPRRGLATVSTLLSTNMHACASSIWTNLCL